MFFTHVDWDLDRCIVRYTKTKSNASAAFTWGCRQLENKGCYGNPISITDDNPSLSNSMSDSWTRNSKTRKGFSVCTLHTATCSFRRCNSFRGNELKTGRPASQIGTQSSLEFRPPRKLAYHSGDSKQTGPNACPRAAITGRALLMLGVSLH